MKAKSMMPRLTGRPSSIPLHATQTEAQQTPARPGDATVVRIEGLDTDSQTLWGYLDRLARLLREAYERLGGGESDGVHCSVGPSMCQRCLPVSGS